MATKYVVLVGDGMADFPIPEFNNRTPLEIARTPNMNKIARGGSGGFVRTIPRGSEPGSDVANMSILGYDPDSSYTGRGPLEALALGIKLEPGQLAFRCNLVTVADGVMADYSGGHVSTEEARVLMESLDKALSNNFTRFYPGISYRNIVVIDESALSGGRGALRCVPPHDIAGKLISANLPKGKGSAYLIDLMDKSKHVLENAEINKVKIDLKENPANMIWLWGFGKMPDMKSFEERFGVKGGIISAVSLLKGIGHALKMRVIDVPGATGYYDTNYKAKAEYCLDALNSGCDFVLVHVEAADEAGHNGDMKQKVMAIENFDEKVVGAILEGIKKFDEFRVLVLPDHYTPVSLKTHIADPVPFAMCGSGIKVDKMDRLTEEEARKGSYDKVVGHKLLDMFIKNGY